MTRDLTPRQWQILALLAEGLNQPAIVERLGISRHTLRNHLYGHFGYPGLYERIGAGSDVQAVIWYFRAGQYQRPAWDVRDPDGR